MIEPMLCAENPLGFLTQFGVQWQLLLSQALSFALVALALYYFVFRPVIAVSNKRQAEIERGLKDAANARAKLASAEEDAKDRLRKTAEEASQMLDKARESAKRTVEVAAAEANAKAAQIFEKNEAQIQKQKELMKEELKSELSGMVAKAAANVLDEILTDEQRSKLADIAAKKLAEDK